MSLSVQLDPNRAVKTPRALKAERTRHRVTFNPSKASPGETLYVAVPKLDQGVVIAPGTMALRFDLVVSGQANNYVVDNVSRALVNRMTLKFGGEVIQDLNRYDLYQIFADFFLPNRERQNRILEGIQSTDLNKLRSGAGNAKKDNQVNNALLAVYGGKYRIPLDHEILRDHGVFYPQALNDALVFEIALAPADQVVLGADPSKLGYELNNIELEYEVIRNDVLAQDTSSVYRSGKMFFYDHVSLHKTLIVKRDTDTILNETINVPRRSMKGLLLLFVEPYTAGTRDSQKFTNPDITSVKVTVDGTPNKVYSQGMEGKDMWEEVARHFIIAEQHETAMTPISYYTGNQFGLFVDLRSTSDNTLHGSGLRLVNSKGGVQLEMKRSTSGSGNLNCHVFVISDAQVNLLNGQLDSIQY